MDGDIPPNTIYSPENPHSKVVHERIYSDLF